MTRRACLVLLACCGLAIAGCTAPLVREAREAPTGMDEGAEIAILLASYGRHSGVGKSNKELEVDRAEVEKALDACLRREMLSARDGLRFVDSRALRQAVFPGQDEREIDSRDEKILWQLADARLAQDARLARLRYVILLDATQWDSGAQPQFIAPASGYALAFAATSMRVLSVRATVLDVAHRRTAGSVSAYMRGERGGGVAVVIIIPIPFYADTMPEVADLCTTLGRALVKFLAP